MQRGHENLPYVAAGTIQPVRKAISFLTKEQETVYCGREVLAGGIIIHSPDFEHRRNGPNRSWGSMSLTHDDFDAACKAITVREFLGDKLKFIVRPSPDLMSRLLKLHETVGQIAKTTPALLELPQVSRALEQQLVYLIVRCLTEGAFLEITVGGHRHDAIVTRFEEFLEANPNTPHTCLKFALLSAQPNEPSVTPAKNILEWGLSATSRCGECTLSAERWYARFLRRQQ
jgi:hypothetical protein